MVGLVFDIVGAFLVSVEAIKIENLRKLGTRVLDPLHRLTLSPIIELADESQNQAPKASRRVNLSVPLFLSLYFSLHIAAGAMALYIVDRAFHHSLSDEISLAAKWVLARSVILRILIFGLVPIWGLIGLWTIGEGVHITLTQLTKLPLLVLEWIFRRAPDGTIGIIGFLLLFIGFVLQFYSNHLQSNPSALHR